MKLRRSLAFTLLVVIASLACPPHVAVATVTMEWVTVGDVYNPADPLRGHGSVEYEYKIGKYEVTLGQYVEFLNSVAKSDPFGLYNPNMATDPNIAGIRRSGTSGNYSYTTIGSANRPVTYVSWFDAARMANWMHNGQGSGSTETGAYNLFGARSGIFLAEPGALIRLPTRAEWYKAAYYSGNGDHYWDYPTQSDTPPGNELNGAPNQANYHTNGGYATTPGKLYSPDQNYLTDVGAFTGSVGPYGTFDQAGNVWEWNDEVLEKNGLKRAGLGADWGEGIENNMRRGWERSIVPEREGADTGFRLVSIPDTATVVRTLFQDTFNGWLDPAWSIVRQDARYYSDTTIPLVLRASSGDLYVDSNDCKNLFLIDTPTTGDFVLTLKVHLFVPVYAGGYPQLAVVAYDDDDNYVQSSYGSMAGDLSLQLATEVEADFHQSKTVRSFGSGPFWLQLRKTGTSYAQFFSTDGIDFSRANEAVTYGDGTPAKVGFVAMADNLEFSQAHIESFTVRGNHVTRRQGIILEDLRVLPNHEVRFRLVGESGRWFDIQLSTDLRNWETCQTVYNAWSTKEITQVLTEGIREGSVYFRAREVEEGASQGFVLIPAGSFEMGDERREGSQYDDHWSEEPVHLVDVSGFYMGRYEVTKALWDEVRAWGVSHGYHDLAEGHGDRGPDHPVTAIWWYDMVKWCNACSEKDGLTPCYRVDGLVYRAGDSDAVTCDWGADGYRLPTEAEWEKAARGGLTGLRFPWGETISHANACFHNSGGESYQTGTTGPHPDWQGGTAPVGSFGPNGYGLYDMAGNAEESCWDWWGVDYYPSSPDTNPRGPAAGHGHVVRGGSFLSYAVGPRCAHRHWLPSRSVVVSNYDQGFRLARSQ